jgi:predicted amidophosphoribosyltransferase
MKWRRHEIPRNIEKKKELGLEKYLEFQKKRWACPSCEGTVRFYRYTCGRCGKKVDV